MSRFEVLKPRLGGLTLVERKPLGDSRGSFTRVFCAEDLSPAGWRGSIAQINASFTAMKGTVRGLHYQRPPHSEFKLVTCLRGSIWDVAVDLRAESPTFLQWHGEVLSEDNNRAMLIPPGFAHGFQTLSDGVDLLYCHSAAFAADHEGALNPLDPRLAISWPEPITEMSPRDRSHPPVTSDFRGVIS